MINYFIKLDPVGLNEAYSLLECLAEFGPSSLQNSVLPYTIDLIAIGESKDELRESWRETFLMSAEDVDYKFIYPVMGEIDQMKKLGRIARFRKRRSQKKLLKIIQNLQPDSEE